MKGKKIMAYTKKFYFETLKNIYAENRNIFPSDIDFNEFFDKEIAALGKKAAKTSEVHAKEEEMLRDVLTNAEAPMTAMDIIRGHEWFADLSTQKVAAIANRLVAEGEVNKEKSDRGIVYSIATAAE